MVKGVNPKSARGVVVSDKMIQTIVVQVERLVKHPLYKKYIRRRSKIHVHDPENTARIGDHVKIVETKPIAKHKTWRLVEILSNEG